MASKPLKLIREFSSGDGVLKVTPTHPLVAALRLGLERGKPPGSWCLVVVLGIDRKDNRLLGTLSLSRGGRLIFFPGAPVAVDSYDGKPSRFDGRYLDHVTLDPPDTRSRYRSHVAVRGLAKRKSRGLGFRTEAPPGHLVPWLSILVRRLDSFCLLPGRLEVEFPAPRPDLKAFAAELFSQPSIAAAPAPEASGSPSFFQFDIWAGRGRGWRGLASRPLSWAYKTELVSNAPSGSQDVGSESRWDLWLLPLDGERTRAEEVRRALGEATGGRIEIGA